MSKLLYFKTCKLMYLLIALFLRHFIIVVNYYFHAFGETIADFDAVFIEDLMGALVLRKMLIK